MKAKKLAMPQAGPVAVEALKVNLGAGKSKVPGFLSVDAIKFDEVDLVADLRKRWPWKDNSIDEAMCSHFLEHLDALERVHFFNELFRTLKPGSRCVITTPAWSSCRAYGDPTHKWPPVSEFAPFYTNKAWRDGNAPHTDSQYAPGMFNCDFDFTGSFTMNATLIPRNAEYQNFAVQNFKEAAPDIITTYTKRAPANA